MQKSCLCEPSEVLIFPCSGASNCGQITNEIGLRLREARKGRMYCTVGIGGHIKGLVEGARDAKVIVGIDGCAVGCVKKCLEAEGLSLNLYIVVSDELEVKKSFERPKEDDVRGAFDFILPRIEDAMKRETN